MIVRMPSAGLVVEVEARGRWAELVREACAGQQLPAGTGPAADVRIRITHGRDGSVARPEGLRPLTRGAWSDGSTVLLADACASGVDLVLRPHPDHLEVVATPRPSWRHRALGVAAPDRRVLLSRAAVLQYPVLWWAGVRGHVPLHVSAATIRDAALVLAGPGGVGKSTLLATTEAAGGIPVSDNLCVTDGRVVHGLLEPSRRDDGDGRRMPHGRREGTWPRLAPSAAPTAVVVLHRGQGPAPQLRRIPAAAAVRELVGGTYAAGELRRYWAFAATAALGTGLGPVHPPVAAACERLAEGTETYELRLPSARSLGLGQVVDLLEAAGPGEPSRPGKSREVSQP